MKIIIVGAGEVGHNLCSTLAAAGHDVTLIDAPALEYNSRDWNGIYYDDFINFSVHFIL